MNNNSITFPGLLTILFIGLKLTEYIDWSWFLVLLPFYLPLVIVIIFFICSFIIMSIVEMFSILTTKEKRN